jgi:hypothetical protein
MRQGVHLPHDSIAQKSMAKRACAAMSTVSSNATMPPCPSSARSRERFVVDQGVELGRRQVGAERAADLNGAQRPAARLPPPKS